MFSGGRARMATKLQFEFCDVHVGSEVWDEWTRRSHPYCCKRKNFHRNGKFPLFRRINKWLKWLMARARLKTNAKKWMQRRENNKLSWIFMIWCQSELTGIQLGCCQWKSKIPSMRLNDAMRKKKNRQWQVTVRAQRREKFRIVPSNTNGPVARNTHQPIGTCRSKSPHRC